MVGGSEDGNEQLDSIIADLLEAVETGQSVDETEWLCRHPQYAAELRDFFESWQQVRRLSAPFRAVVQRPTPVELKLPLGDFQIIREIGRGGMGIVYEARQLSLGRRIALKVLPLAAVLDRRQLQRFKNEAQAAAQLRHPNIVGVHSVGCERGMHFYAMEFIEGRSLAQLIEQQRESRPDSRPQSASARAVKVYREPTRDVAADTRRGISSAATTPADSIRSVRTTHSSNGSTRSHEFFRSVADLGYQAAEALDYAHQHGIIHRDVKPANLLVDADRHLWITDFGLAKMDTGAGLTATGDVIGTLRYMSPEQASGSRTMDHRTDIYSLGVTLYELLVLRPAFPGSDRQVLLRQIAEDQPPPLRRLNRAIPTDLETVVLKATHKSPADRYGTAREMADDLQRFLAGQPVLAKRLTPVERLTRWAVRHKALVAALMIAMTLTTLSLAVATALITHERARVIAASADLEAALGRERRLREDAERGQQQLREQNQRALANAAFARSHLAELQTQAAAYEIYVPDSGGKQKLQFVPKPVLNWDHSVAEPSSKVSVGSVFVWLRDHRPEVVGTVFRNVNREEKSTPHELHSFAPGPLTAEYRGVSIWSPAEGGVRLQPMHSVPEPADSARDRRAQMRMLASRFTATTETDGQVESLNLQPEPFYRYGRSGDDPLDGALFAFCWITDPELLLMIEARGSSAASRWHFALARLSRKPLSADYQQTPIWSVPLVRTPGWDRNIVECPEVQKRSYIVFRPSLVPEIHIGDRRRELAASYDRLGLALLRAGRHGEATKATGEALRIWQQSGPDGARDRVRLLDSDSLYMDLIVALRSSDRFQEAKALTMEAVREYQQLAPKFPENERLHYRLAWLYAELGHWDQTANHLTAVAKLDADLDSKASWLSDVAFAHLAGGQLQAYSRTCTELIDRFGDTQNHETMAWIVEACLYAPGAVEDFDKLVQLASEGDERLAEGRNPVVAQYAHAAAIYRAGRIKDAADRLGRLVVECEKRETHLADVCGTATRLFLAMACARLGDRVTARAKLDAAIRWMESKRQHSSGGNFRQIDQLQWYTRIRMRTLRREAEAMLGERNEEGDLPPEEVAENTE